MYDNSTELKKELQPGMELGGGKYVIDKKIGEGGFGITYRAVQKGLNRVVCIKEYFLAGRCVRNTYNRTVHLSGISEDMFEKYRKAFVREAETLATLRHPNIVEVIDVFNENNTSYMVMPFLEGRSLQSVVEKNGPLTVPDAINFIAQVANAVGYIHERHILHRDIKPDNIMITADCKAILIDFGSARQFEQDKTQVQTAMLTHGYAPTEQYTANSRKGSYTDIYAIGATLYFVLTGQVPLEAAARMTEPMPEPKELNPAIPDEINRTILKAMQIKAENRHQTVQEFMDDLLDIKPSELVDESIGGKTVIVEKNKKWIWWAIGAAVVAIAALSVWLVMRPKVAVRDGVVLAKTEDFTGMDLYPMIWVEGGSFTMGDGGQNEIDGDCPPHQVELDGFWIGQYEVSRELWEEIMGTDPSQCMQKPDGSPLTAEEKKTLPVENITYADAMEFVARLNNRTGEHFALPTEAQWEYAARGGNKSQGHKYANGQDVPRDIKIKQDVPSRTISPSTTNELGIFHMSGNVAEWCLDYYDEDFYTTSAVQSSNPANRSMNMDNDLHVIRGGSFKDNDASDALKVFHREADDDAQCFIGLRLIATK